MSLGEFELITRYFKQCVQDNAENGISIGIGDDCAILDIPEGYQLAVTTDSLVAGVHFFEDVSPYRLGYKALAVNLSDLAAMGAAPKWLSLAITLPQVDAHWLSEFSRGFFELAGKHHVSLIGGDTTKGPLSITVSAKGLVPRHQALLRSGAQVGDFICVSGTLGDGALGLACKTAHQTILHSNTFIDALELTEPRNCLGQQLIGVASSCIDISDGLIQDLQHILKASQCHAEIDSEKLPLSDAMLAEINRQTISREQASEYALTGGDDYELLFTLSPEAYRQFCLKNENTLGTSITVIGKVTQGQEAQVSVKKAGETLALQASGWDHFKKNKS